MEENTLLWMFMNEGKLAMDECSEQSTIYSKGYKEDEKKLLETLNKEQTSLFHNFRFSFLYHILAVRDKECGNIIFECFKMGMEFQTFLNNKDE